ncbi:MAG TPA: phosphotransferase [Thermoanaerobaculia bacterium]|nr:phosphotransferase [Thermoanaerobaculia bacterium]
MSSSRLPADFSALVALAERTRHEPVSFEVLPGDVGRRRYVRLFLKDNRSVLGVVYPEEETDSRRRWTAARTVLRDRVRVPVLIADDQRGNQLVEDFGPLDLATKLSGAPGDRESWLCRAASAAVAFAQTADPGINAPFEAALFRRELELAREAVFDLYLRAPLSAEERTVHDRWADALAAEVASHPRALCHRDFHGNNLFPAEETIAAIDFQDLRSGPDSYDLASLLWERTTLEWMTPGLADGAIEEFVGARKIDPAPFRERFRRVLLQRAWKVCGTFARAVAQGKGEGYRRYLPGEIDLVGRLLGDGPEDREFRALYDARLAALVS